MVKYPKTYDECCNVLNVTPDNIKNNIKLQYDSKPLKDFQRVIICRDAYLSFFNIKKHRIPKTKYIIKLSNGELVKDTTDKTSYILSFPTKEMRDAFYHNFYNDIIKVATIL